MPDMLQTCKWNPSTTSLTPTNAETRALFALGDERWELREGAKNTQCDEDCTRCSTGNVDSTGSLTKKQLAYPGPCGVEPEQSVDKRAFSGQLLVWRLQASSLAGGLSSIHSTSSRHKGRRSHSASETKKSGTHMSCRSLPPMPRHCRSLPPIPPARRESEVPQAGVHPRLSASATDAPSSWRVRSASEWPY